LCIEYNSKLSRMSEAVLGWCWAGVGLVAAAASDTCMPHKTFAESNADGADANIEIGVCVAWHSIVPHISKH
jgi:hypothetical protein